VQQRSGRVTNPSAAGVTVVRDARMDAEAERMAQRASLHHAPAVAPPIQLKKASKQQREAQKRAKRCANAAMQVGPQVAVGVKFSVATKLAGRKTYRAYSGVGGADLAVMTYLDPANTVDLPWKNLVSMMDARY
jgi:hypothetical protein